LTDNPARTATYQAVKIAREAGALISFDVNYRPSLWKHPDHALLEAKKMIKEVTLVKVNETEAVLLTGLDRLDPTNPVEVEKAALDLLDQGPELVVVTLGAEGSYFQGRQGGAYVPPFKVKTVDAVGCGDAFVAGLLTRLAVEKNWQEQLGVQKLADIVRFANAVGALTSQKRGALPAMPTADQVDDFLNKIN